jgi:hypothetical protein
MVQSAHPLVGSSQNMLPKTIDWTNPGSIDKTLRKVKVVMPVRRQG